LTTCRIYSEYFDYDKMQHFTVKCEEEAQDNGLCIFHDSNYLNDEFNNPEKEERVRQRFLELINNNNSRSEPILCLGYHLPSVQITVTFVNNVYFDAINFHGTADFSNSKFNKIANFYKCIFERTANFSKCQFSKMANFGNVAFFKETAIFDHVLFLDVASFGEAHFNCGTNFSQTEFRHNANFFETHFYDIAIFFGADFNKDANFMQSKFLKPSLQSPCTLSAKSVLGRVLFMKSTSYNDSVRFRGRYILEDIPHLDIQNLRSYVDFRDAKFANVAIFNAARFDIESEFINVIFSGQTSFTNTSFSEKCVFVGVAFSNPVNFEKTEFLMECDFINCLFSNEANFIDTKFEKETRFENVLFEKPERVKIIVESLSHASFVNTDITRVFFPAQVKWGDHDTFEVFSDRQMKETLADGTILDKSNIESVSSMYRSLREELRI
jgi:hypothetical protein